MRKARCVPGYLEAELETKSFGMAPMRMGLSKTRQAEEGTSKVTPDPGRLQDVGYTSWLAKVRGQYLTSGSVRH